MGSVAKISEVRQQLSKSAEGVPLIGWFVYWSITNVKVNYNDLINMMETIGLDTDAATPIRQKSAFIRAVEEVAHSQGARHQKIVDNIAQTVYIIVKTHVDQANLDATFTTETKAIFKKIDGTVEVQGPFGAEISAHFADYSENYYSDQFRDMILRLLDSHCQYLTIRDRGGIYFVPSVHEDGLDLIKQLFKNFSECYFETVGVANMAEAKQSMWRTLVGEVNSEIQKMKEDIASAAPDMSDSSMRVRLERYKELREKVENYEFVLAGTAEALKNELTDLSNLLREKLS